jgi:hypothetical protein
VVLKIKNIQQKKNANFPVINTGNGTGDFPINFIIVILC